MQPYHIVITQDYYPNTPIIDQEFDRFELNEDLENTLREAEAAILCHLSFDVEE